MDQKEKKQHAGSAEIDEQYLIAMMAKEELPAPSSPNIPVEVVDPKVSPETKSRPSDYDSLFLKNSEETARYGKTIYIRKEFHERIQRIVQTLGGNQVSLYSYIDNVLAHHFDMYQDDIREGYEKKQKPIF